MRKYLISILIFASCSIVLYSQGEISEDRILYFTNEYVIGLTLHSNGYGGSFRYGKRVDFFKKDLYEGEIQIFKHPKEYAQRNINFPNKKFVFGKLNSVFALKGGRGFQKEMFSKQDKGGISIKYFYNYGATISFAKPIYYKVLYPSSNYYTEEIEKFDITIHEPELIYSRASFFKGLNEIQVIPGLYGKAGLQFEYSSTSGILNAIEGGIMLDAYLSRIQIMASDKGRLIFPGLFITYRFGRTIDPYSKIRKRELREYLDEIL
ncbi:hypothetical protein ACFLSA_01565 [Bacteroidota bacterium]